MYSGITDTNRVYCYKHQEKVIEYFCRECHTLVCPRCMFEDHNGHQFAELADVTHVIRQNIKDLQSLLTSTNTVNS
jgi:hypothetical protein